MTYLCTLVGDERPTRKPHHRRRFSTEGRLEGTSDIETIETRAGRAGSIITPPPSVYEENPEHRQYFALSTARTKKDKEKLHNEEKQRLKQIKKLETDQESHPIAWAVGRFLFPFEIGFQV